MRPRRPYAAANRRSLIDPWVKTISSPNEGTPTDLMLVPNCPDQKAGTKRCGRRLVSSLTMLLPATSAPRTALSQCSIERNSYSNRKCGERAMSPATKILSVTTPDVESAAASVASDAPEAGGQPGAFQPFDVAQRAKRRQYHIDFERASVGETDAPYMPA